MDVKMEPSWKTRLAGEFEKDYFVKLTDFVRQEYRQTTVYPSGPNIFNAFAHCPFDRVPRAATSRVGPTKACCCSTPP